MSEESTNEQSDWFARNSDRRNPTAFINTDPVYFASECASAIQNGTLVPTGPLPWTYAIGHTLT